ncbi:hypothetical protein HMPREF9156_00782 [Scardovia wiggsiae F0424]|uniref:Uncharacterized protein n=1 Tax=Scardovia wiggsiae F0424 TaxID=857290 RepID=J0LM78_9BIFI|nr:hypothetical protein HMPREF9156_00782 [Scardovia wiggsiae F0424]
MGKGTNPACFNTPSGSPASFAATGIFNYELTPAAYPAAGVYSRLRVIVLLQLPVW